MESGFFSKMFGGKKETNISTADAIQKLRETENLLIRKQEYLEKKIEDELAKAKKNATKNKKVALLALSSKKKYEKQLQQIDGTLSTIEMQREALESANINTSVLANMKSAAAAMKVAHQNMNVDDVQNMMDDIAEQHDVAKEISDAISSPAGFDQGIDTDELEKELEELEQEELDKDLLGVGTSAQELPDVPTTEPSASKKEKKKAKAEEEDEDMKLLMSWAN